MKWIHLYLRFANHQDLMVDAAKLRPVGVYKELILYVGGIVHSLYPILVHRYYYLFEGNSPPLFLALELKNETDLPAVEKVIKEKVKPGFVSDVKIVPVDDKVGDPDEAIALYQAGAQYAFYRCSDKYSPPWKNGLDLIHLVHCFSNQLFVDWINEIKFYSDCLQGRSTLLQHAFVTQIIQRQEQKNNITV